MRSDKRYELTEAQHLQALMELTFLQAMISERGEDGKPFRFNAHTRDHFQQSLARLIEMLSSAPAGR